MAHPLVWPGKYYFYPIGNTSAVCLTRDIAPDEPADILSLGCGDPRNVLYTIFSEPQPAIRKLDFTCCDFEPGILARNVILFTMVADKQSYSTIWNIFFHLYLDCESHSILIEQCKKLVGYSQSLQTWDASPYGSTLKMCTAYTLSELRRHWTLYIDMHDLPSERQKMIRAAFKDLFKPIMAKTSKNALPSAARSSGPVMGLAMQTLSDQCRQYWKTGLTFSNPKLVAAATLLNPTFAYSLEGEGCAVHYGTDPLIPFHLASLFGNAKHPLTIDDAVKAAQTQFNNWCSAFFISVTAAQCPPTIRLFLGEAMTVCRTLHAFAETGTVMLGVPVAQWKTQLIQLNSDDYNLDGAPAQFNVIETSNLDDHIGLLNVLVSTVPLLSKSTPSSVLYVESLLSGAKDATTDFTGRLYINLTVISLLLGVTPIDYLSGFTTRSNVHELIVQLVSKGNSTQFHQVTTWKMPTSGDISSDAPALPPTFDPSQLGTLLYDIYHDVFEHEDALNFSKMNQGNMLKAIARSNLIHYIRESFVLFLKLIRDKNQIKDEQWIQVMDRFFDIQREDHSLRMDTLAFNDLCAQLHRHGVHTVQFLQGTFPKIGRFSRWRSLTPIVRILLVIPHEKLAVLEDSNLGTPLLQCDVRGTTAMNNFTSVHVAFGRVVPMGTPDNPWVVFEEDPLGRKGSMPLVATFTMPTWLLTDIEPMENLRVSLSVRSTTGTVLLIPKLGLALHVFTASFVDKSHVHVLPEYPLPSKRRPPPPSTSKPLHMHSFTEIGSAGPAHVELDEQCELVSSLTIRISVENEQVQALLRSAAVPEMVQISACTMRVSIAGFIQNVLFPFPIIGSQHKLRLARKSLYIEVVVPVSGPFKPDGMMLNPFPVVSSSQTFNPWSIHHVNMSRMPTLDITVPKISQWLNPHIGASMSTRERSLRKRDTNDMLMSVKDTILRIFFGSAGIQGPVKRVFAIADGPTKNCDTIIFVSELKFDLHSHTVLCDGYVLPLTHALLEKMETPFSQLIKKGDIVRFGTREGEMRAWKLLLPALVERCRTSWKHGENCEYRGQGKVPLTDMMEMDPLCSCGRGKDTEGMQKVALWSKWAPYVTRFALSPLFAVSYLETIGRDPARYRCFVCRAKGKPKLLMCTICRKVRYCSKDCQKKDWKAHKARCKP
ncbi:hypothetical protein Hypma_007901 [Hypsizygus marmoreus]|uniref:MYND-type domain-containing protein n=1 Tax=Hypsizygus marmoreus TaxID=39966 RepID=A0A369JU16_HYPMA|nr:hypothetical protein Hypma_007901 [Hypsizygus marmoreus]